MHADPAGTVAYITEHAFFNESGKFKDQKIVCFGGVADHGAIRTAARQGGCWQKTAFKTSGPRSYKTLKRETQEHGSAEANPGLASIFHPALGNTCNRWQPALPKAL